MPLTVGGPKTLWFFSGVFLFMGILVIVATAQALPVALFLPALYSIFFDRVSPYTKPLAVASIPAALIVVPGFMHSVILYMFLIACGVLIHWSASRKDAGMAVFLPSCLLLILFILSIRVMAWQEGILFQDIVARWVGDVMNQISVVYDRILPSGELADFRINRGAMEARITDLFWGIIASSILSIMWLNLVITTALRKTMQLRTWKCPDWFVGFFILSGLFILMKYDNVRVLGLNLMIVVSQVYFFQGLAIVASVMTEYNWSKVIRLVVYILILSQIYIMIVVTALGLFDTWFNFRNMIRSSEGDIT
ncbi:MAG: DUF2232 domain-containing protein [Desulfomonilia bacterium]